MKPTFIIANFKSHKTRAEMEQWMDGFDSAFLKKKFEDKTVILAPSMPSVMFVSNRLLAYTESFALGIQDISPYPAGAYTGAVSSENLDGFNIKFVLVGHSERRTHFHESNEEIAEKCKMVRTANLTPILCVQGTETPIPDGITIVAFEPVNAIGTGNPDTPEDANIVAEKIKEKHPGVTTVLYGGSVTSENVRQFTNQEQLSGVLVGSASLNPQSFIDIVNNA